MITRICSDCKQEYPATSEYFHGNKQRSHGLSTICKSCRRLRSRDYYQVNADVQHERRKKYNKRIVDSNRERRIKNKSKYAEYDRQWQQDNRDKKRINESKRRARKRGLPSTFTHGQWLQCLEYHHHCCAVCGTQLRDLFGNVFPHADHWIPLSNPDCMGTVAGNVICLCNDCNQAKWNKLPAVWLTERYGTRKANIILARVEAYFAWILSQKEGAA